MCCLFGLLDYGHSLTAAQKNHILAVLSTVCEARGTDATGIAYNTDNGCNDRLSGSCITFQKYGPSLFCLSLFCDALVCMAFTIFVKVAICLSVRLV